MLVSSASAACQKRLEPQATQNARRALRSLCGLSIHRSESPASMTRSPASVDVYAPM
jgi:hypothetical protein